jgi:hypothetical protein
LNAQTTEEIGSWHKVECSTNKEAKCASSEDTTKTTKDEKDDVSECNLDSKAPEHNET